MTADTAILDRERRPEGFDWENGYAPAGTPTTQIGQAQEWPEPVPLPNGLRAVKAFDPEFLPSSLANWVQDISERMQCPPDFVAIPAMVALGAVIGRRIGIRPQRRTDWMEVPNLWGCIVGRPGALKSPAIEAALKPLHQLERKAHQANDEARKEYARSMEIYELRKDAAKTRAKTAIKNGGSFELATIDEPEPPRSQRFIVNDATYEKLGEILADNPNGVLAHRDELVSLLKGLDREENAAARGFFLSAWNGKDGYTFDRIIRGQTRIEAACLSLLGSTQPGRSRVCSACSGWWRRR